MAGNSCSLHPSSLILHPFRTVRGYREIRYPKMDEAKRKVDSLLNTTASATAKQSVLV